MDKDKRKEEHDLIKVEGTQLFDRVVCILEQARSHVVRAVNANMVHAYWLIGREIVEEVQGGQERAVYGKKVLETLSIQLQSRYKTGFSVANLKRFRQFYQVYATRLTGSPAGSDSSNQLAPQWGANSAEPGKPHPAGAVLPPVLSKHPADKASPQGFSPQLSWSHYRALMRVSNVQARLFYEYEAIESAWDKRTLERHIHSFYYERMLKSQNPSAMLTQARKELPTQDASINTLKNPYVLEFLGLPEPNTLHETHLEAAIISHLQSFLLELGKGFAFVARQKRLRFDDTDLYVDLVFYNCILKCYLLIDLKMGELSHQDVGQMDGYVRMFDDLYTAKDDNPTIGLILCTEKNEAVARYSVLSERKQIFASKYMLYLPTEEELKLEIQKERKLIEAAMAEKDHLLSEPGLPDEEEGV